MIFSPEEINFNFQIYNFSNNSQHCIGIRVGREEGEAGGLGDFFVAPAFAADCCVPVVATNLNLCAVFDKVAVCIKTGIHDGLVPTRAGGFNLVDGVGYLKQPS